MALQNPDQLKLITPSKPRKYRNMVFKDEHGVTWHSNAEYRRYQLLKALEGQDQIRDLQRQVRFKLDVKGCKVCQYIADFVYDERSNGKWVRVVEDVKSAPTKTREYKLKKRLMWAVHGIEIREVER